MTMTAVAQAAVPQYIKIPPPPPISATAVITEIDTITISWTPPADTLLVAEYEVFWATSSPVGTAAVSVGRVPVGTNTLDHVRGTDAWGVVPIMYYEVYSIEETGTLYSTTGAPAQTPPPYFGCDPDTSWLPFTTTTGEQKIEVLTLVAANASQEVKFTVSVAGPSYMVDWGDGSAPQTVNTGILATHMYAGATLPATPVSSDNKVMAMATITPTSGTLTEFRFGQNDFAGFTAAVTGPSTLAWVGSGSSTGEKYPNTIKVVSALAPPVLTATDASWIFSDMTKICAVPMLDTALGRTFMATFEYCSALTMVPLINTSGGTNFNNLFYNDRSLQSVPKLDMGGGTLFSFTFTYCTALSNNLASNFRYTISVSGCPMDVAALNTFFTNLGTADNSVSQQSVRINGTTGAGGCDDSIAIAKGWSVVRSLVGRMKSSIEMEIHPVELGQSVTVEYLPPGGGTKVIAQKTRAVETDPIITITADMFPGMTEFQPGSYTILGGDDPGVVELVPLALSGFGEVTASGLPPGEYCGLYSKPEDPAGAVFDPTPVVAGPDGTAVFTIQGGQAAPPGVYTLSTSSQRWTGVLTLL